jgi:cellulose synthase/poly-beta-1,6-N-acetylglucosamine synthase-like glycosyltransferase
MDLIAPTATAWKVVFAVSLSWLFYAYLGYPLLLSLFASFARRQNSLNPGGEPSVTVLTAAYDEAEVIRETIANKLELDYPAERLEILVVSDESTDGTDEIVREFDRSHPGRVRLIRQEPRAGKTSALNLALPQARGEIVVFADANSLYEPGALRALVANFADERVGYVTGRMLYSNPDGSVTGDGCTAYMRYENKLRAWETRIGSVVGVDGGIDAVRKSLYRPMRADQLPDFVLPLRVVEQGYRVAYEPAAVLREPTLASTGQEYRMRVRVTLRALWALLDLRLLFNPVRFPMFSWQLASHKLLRYTAFLPQFAAFLSNALLWNQGSIYPLLFYAQIGFYALAGLGFFVERAGSSFPLATAPYYISLLNLSCAHAWMKFLGGKKQVLWQPRVG